MTSHLNISFFGSSLVSAYWNGAATYYRGLIRALHDRGHRVTFYEPDAYERQQHRDMPDPDWARVVVYQPTESTLLKCLAEAMKNDLIIKCSGVGVFDELLEEAVLKFQGPETQVAFLDVDAAATLERLEANPEDPFKALIPQYDFILTYGGGEPVVRGYIKAGAQECVPIYNALDSYSHFPVASQKRFEADLSFLGNRLPDRESRVEEFFLKPAGLMTLQNFVIGGSGWQDKSMPSNVKNVGHVYTHEHNAFNCSARAVLNISRGSMARFGFSPATRVFEAAGAGACLITDHWEGIELFLEPGEEVLVAESGSEVSELLNKLTPGRAVEIGQKGMNRIKNEHTYAHRADQLERVLEGRFSNK